MLPDNTILNMKGSGFHGYELGEIPAWQWAKWSKWDDFPFRYRHYRNWMLLNLEEINMELEEHCLPPIKIDDTVPILWHTDIMQFGPYRGRSLGDIPDHYLEELSANQSIRESYPEIVKYHNARRKKT